MTRLLNNSLTAGMLAGVTLIAGGAQQAAALSITETAHAGINLSISFGSTTAGGTLDFDGFSAPGTLTGVIMTLNSSVFGDSEGSSVTGATKLTLGTGAAEHGYDVAFTTETYDFVTDLLFDPNVFGFVYAPGDFTGPTVSFTLSMLGDSSSSSFDADWTSTTATLEYIYAAPVPLPAALPLMVVGLAGLAALGRKRG